MFGLRKALNSIVLAVAFIILASLASYFYSSDQTKQVELKNNSLFQKGKEILSVVLGASGEVANANAEKNLGFGNKMVEMVNSFVKNTDWQGMANRTKTVKEGFSENIDNFAVEENNDDDNTVFDLKNIAAEATELTDSVAPVLGADKATSGFFSKVTAKLKEELEKIKAEEADSFNSEVENIFDIKTGEDDAAPETDESLNE